MLLCLCLSVDLFVCPLIFSFLSLYFFRPSTLVSLLPPSLSPCASLSLCLPPPPPPAPFFLLLLYRTVKPSGLVINMVLHPLSPCSHLLYSIPPSFRTTRAYLECCVPSLAAAAESEYILRCAS